MNQKITGTPEIDVKRLHLPLKVDIKCPCCGETSEINFETNYFSYPKLNVSEEIYFLCDNPDCEEALEFDATLTISVEVDTENVRKQ